nr:GRAS transcription factor 13 [Rheum palmatum]
MQTSEDHQGSGGVHRLYHQQSAPQISSYFEIQDGNVVCAPDSMSSGTELSFAADNEGYFTVDSAPAMTVYNVYDSPVLSISSNIDTLSPQPSHSYVSDLHHSSEHTSGSAVSGSSVDNEYQLRTKLQELERSLLGPESGMHMSHETSSLSCDGRREMHLKQDLRQVLILCAEAVANEDLVTARTLMDALGQMVSISGSPIERLAAYMLEGLRARLEFSGFNIYKKLRCEPPTSSELLSYMHILYLICPYYRFAYSSSNIIIHEAMENENRIHIIDFQIAMGTQWTSFIESVSKRPGGPPFVRITGIDDSNSAHARGGGLEIVGNRLSQVAESCGVPFEFHAAAMSGCQVRRDDLITTPEEAIAVTLPYMLHHMPDESVSTENHRDRLLRLIKSLSPKVFTLIEQESNTNTTPFYVRFVETLDYYTAMFESIDVARERNDKQRINAEQHCLARDIVNMIACEGEQRVERHELLGKWKARLSMAGFTQCPVSSSVSEAMAGLLKEYHENYRLKEWQGSLYLGWQNRVLATCSTWR